MLLLSCFHYLSSVHYWVHPLWSGCVADLASKPSCLSVRVRTKELNAADGRCVWVRVHACVRVCARARVLVCTCRCGQGKRLWLALILLDLIEEKPIEGVIGASPRSLSLSLSLSRSLSLTHTHTHEHSHTQSSCTPITLARRVAAQFTHNLPTRTGSQIRPCAQRRTG